MLGTVRGKDRVMSFARKLHSTNENRLTNRIEWKLSNIVDQFLEKGRITTENSFSVTGSVQNLIYVDSSLI